VLNVVDRRVAHVTVSTVQSALRRLFSEARPGRTGRSRARLHRRSRQAGVRPVRRPVVSSNRAGVGPRRRRGQRVGADPANWFGRELPRRTHPPYRGHHRGRRSADKSNASPWQDNCRDPPRSPRLVSVDVVFTQTDGNGRRWRWRCHWRIEGRGDKGNVRAGWRASKLPSKIFLHGANASVA
jgi:hypothetical protein